MARAVGITAAALCQYEHGDQMPRDPIKVRLAAFYGCTVGWLFFGEGEGPMSA